ncbi:MAG: hypothetical protein ABWX65_11650 [Mycetocola sp.]
MARRSTDLRDPLSARAGVCTLGISALFSRSFGLLDAWADILARTSWPTGAPTREAVESLVESLVTGELSAPDAVIIGAGFVATPGFVADSPWEIAWWLGEGNTLGYEGLGDAPRTRKLVAELDPMSESFRDYTAMEWWRVPERTGASHVTGPYVDYLCTDDYTLTLTTPVFRDDELIGVVGVDIYVKRIEAIVLPHLVAVGATTTLVNASGRVVASTDTHRAAGSILRLDGLSELLHADQAPAAVSEPLHGGQRVYSCSGSSLSLVVGP